LDTNNNNLQNENSILSSTKFKLEQEIKDLLLDLETFKSLKDQKIIIDDII